MQRKGQRYRKGLLGNPVMNINLNTSQDIKTGGTGQTGYL